MQHSCCTNPTAMRFSRSIILGTLLFLGVPRCIGQDEEPAKRLAFGFSLGANHASLKADGSYDAAGVLTARTTNGWGFRMGTLSEWRMSNRSALLARAEMSFNPTKVDLLNAGNAVASYNVYHNLLDLSLHATYGWTAGERKIYVLAGPMYRIPNSRTTNDEHVAAITRPDAAIDVGIGREKKLFNFRTALEVRYSQGLRDLFNADQSGDLFFRTVSLNLCFKG